VSTKLAPTDVAAALGSKALYATVRRRVRRSFGHFPQVKVVLQRFGELLQYECDGEEPECMVLLGETGAGKTRLLEYFRDKHPPIQHTDFKEVPVLYFRVPGSCSKSVLYSGLLKALGSPYAKAGNESDKLEQLLTLLRACKVRLVLLDECNHLADRGAQKTHYSMADGIKELLGRGGCPMVLAGTPSLADFVWLNEQISDRFGERVTLEPLSMEPARRAECRAVMSGFMKLLDGMQVIDLTEKRHAESMVLAAGGRLRGVRRLLIRAVEIAEKKNSLLITRAVLSQAFTEVLFQKAKPSRNPFSGRFDGAPLTGLGEPYGTRGGRAS
jgi:Cdc6-like AAA superfamily ATPase